MTIHAEPLRSISTRSASYGSLGPAGPLAIVHRGGMADNPENTMRAFSHAAKLGVNYLETDARATADGVAIAFHDATADRVTDAGGPIDAFTWDELAGVRVGGTEPIVRLDDLLAAFPNHGFVIDVKDTTSIAPLVRAIRRTNSASRVCVAGGWDPWLAALKDACGPGLTTALGWRALTGLYACARLGVRPSKALATGQWAHAAWTLGQWEFMARPKLATRLIDMAHDIGVNVTVWTVNDQAAARRLIDQGADGIISDQPAMVLAATSGRSHHHRAA